MESGAKNMTMKDLEQRMDIIEEQLQAVLQKQREMQILMTKIEGGIVALKWTGAVVGFLLGFGECL